MGKNNANIAHWFRARGEGWKAIVTLILASFLEALVTLTVFAWMGTSSEFLSQIELTLQDGVMLLLALASIACWLAKQTRWLHWVVVAYVGFLTVMLVVGVLYVAISVSLDSDFTGRGWGFALLWETLFLWLQTIMLFAVWYWVLDGGGPEARSQCDYHDTDFLFPQHANELAHWPNWLPRFTDYLFIAFNTNTTFGPADVLVLSRRMKLLMMVQVSLSLIILTVIAAHALSLITS